MNVEPWELALMLWEILNSTSSLIEGDFSLFNLQVSVVKRLATKLYVLVFFLSFFFQPYSISKFTLITFSYFGLLKIQLLSRVHLLFRNGKKRKHPILNFSYFASLVSTFSALFSFLLPARSHSAIHGTGWSSGMKREGWKNLKCLCLCIKYLPHHQIRRASSQLLTCFVHIDWRSPCEFIFYPIVLSRDRSLVHAGNCFVWSMEFNPMVQCVKRTTLTVTRMLYSAVVTTTTQPNSQNVCQGLLWLIWNQFPSMKSEPVVTARYLIPLRS